MALSFTAPNPGHNGRHAMTWGFQTIYFTMWAKASRLGKIPQNPDDYALMGEVAGKVAKRLYDEIAKQPDVMAAYLELVIRWSQDHLAKD